MEQYENEKKKQTLSPKSNKLIGEKGGSISGNPQGNKKSDNLNKNDSLNNLDTPSSSSSTDGDWEKINDVDK